MHIWVDADACPKVIKEILFRAAVRTKTLLTLVANQPLQTPPSPFIKKMLAPAGFDAADNHIIQSIKSGDLVITADIPLADAVIDRGAIVLDTRGSLLTKENIKQRLAMRNFNEDMRSTGLYTGGPAKLSKKELETFANYLDKFLRCR